MIYVKQNHILHTPIILVTIGLWKLTVDIGRRFSRFEDTKEKYDYLSHVFFKEELNGRN